MATSYEEVYDVFLSKVDDVEVLYPYVNETDIEYNNRINTLLLSTFKQSVVKFFHSKTNLSRNDSILSFNNDLRPIEIEVLGL
jgi:hypothetical protein